MELYFCDYIQCAYGYTYLFTSVLMDMRIYSIIVDIVELIILQHRKLYIVQNTHCTLHYNNIHEYHYISIQIAYSLLYIPNI